MPAEDKTQDKQQDNQSSPSTSKPSGELSEKNEDYGKKIRDMLKERQQIQQQQQ